MGHAFVGIGTDGNTAREIRLAATGALSTHAGPLCLVLRNLAPTGICAGIYRVVCRAAYRGAGGAALRVGRIFGVVDFDSVGYYFGTHRTQKNGAILAAIS